MFNDDEDYGFLTGGLGDLDGDGRVDFAEYMNEEDDYQRIMGNHDDDDFSISDDDDDWEFSYIDTAAEYGLSPYDYADKEEFFEALALAKSENYDLEDEYNNEEYCDYNDDTDENVDEYEDSEDENENEEIYLPDGFDINKSSLIIGATTSLNYGGKPIDQVFGVSEENDISFAVSFALPVPFFSLHIPFPKSFLYSLYEADHHILRPIRIWHIPFCMSSLSAVLLSACACLDDCAVDVIYLTLTAMFRHIFYTNASM